MMPGPARAASRTRLSPGNGIMRVWLALAEVLLCAAACFTGLNAISLALAGGPGIGFALSGLLCVLSISTAVWCGFVMRSAAEREDLAERRARSAGPYCKPPPPIAF